MDLYDLCTRSCRNSTKLSREDIKNIVDDINSGMSYNFVQKKYKIGSSRLVTILKMFDCKSTLMNKNKLEMKEKCIVVEKPVSNALDDLLEKRTKEIKDRLDSMQLHSFI